MPAAFHREQETVLRGEFHRGSYVGRAGDLCDLGGVLIERRIEDPSCLLVTFVLGELEIAL